MGLLERIRGAVSLGMPGDGTTWSTARRPLRVGSPWGGGGSIQRAVIADVFGAASLPMTREVAMRVSSVKKGRALIAGTLSRYPLKAYRAEAELAAQPTWLYRTDTGQSPQQRMLWTLDDLIFHGCSLWAVQRGAGDRITDAVRVPFDEWEVNDDLQVLVQGRVVSREEVVYIEGPQDGLLDTAADDIRASLSMQAAWKARVDTPVPIVELHQTDDVELDDAELAGLMDDWATARRNGGVAYTPKAIEAREHGQAPTDLFVQGRNAARIDFANHLALPVALLDGSPATASLTYSTKGDSRNELVDLSLSYWSGPIAARLSMDDVVPRGTSVDFDISWLATPTQPTTANPARED
ncbi:phage portal protein [Xylanimonas ulmi]|uniref:Phage portal protein n=1 Tax=Xylanimonas ulmi TaxID=228973 RepID=A0A4Q7M0P0_9MICO|nr:phage portal protein [Xylanibacterium ulmi]RZS60453.1 hypothetical protein EV386_0711 [Xylanibacterium ulmi]